MYKQVDWAKNKPYSINRSSWIFFYKRLGKIL